jgi:DNA-binding MarR family transcriptional regulator
LAKTRPADASSAESAKKESKPLETPAAELAAFLGAVNKMTSRLMGAPAAAGIDITIPDWLLLRIISEGGAASIAEVARKIGVSRQRAHQQVAQLEAAGLLAPASGEDVRSRRLALSDAGRELIRRIDDGFGEALTKPGEATLKQIHTARRAAQKVSQALAPRKDIPAEA